MRTYTIHFNPDFCQSTHTVEADELDLDVDYPFMVFRAKGETVALVKSSDVQHIEVTVPKGDREMVEMPPAVQTRLYDAKKVSCSVEEGGQRIKIVTPPNHRTWVTSELSESQAVRALAMDAAKEFGFSTVGPIDGSLVSDVESGYTRRVWMAEVS